MKKIILNLSLIVCSLVISTQYILAQSFESAFIFRSTIIFDQGSFPGAIDIDHMVASTVLTEVSDPNGYLVHLISNNPSFAETYLQNYADIGGGEYNFAGAYTIPTPGSAWEGYTYDFDLVDSQTNLIVYDSAQQFIPIGYVTNPLDTPSWYSFSGDLLNPTISWGATLSPSTGLYRIIVYEIDPDGYSYESAVYRSRRFVATTFTLGDFTLVYGKSYDINIQSNLINLDHIKSRSNYHVRYDTAPATGVIDIKPGSDPNCLNINSHGVIPVAINGSEYLNVYDIDVDTLLFGGLAVRIRGNRGPLCSIEDWNGDGHSDLVCHFDDDPDTWTPGEDFATLTGALLDGTPFEGTDSICVVP